MRDVKPLEARLWAKLVPTHHGCLEWAGAKNRKDGYGIIGLGRRGEGNDYVHRVAWRLAKGPIPDGMMVCHQCDNPICAKVSHLFLGAAVDNQRDMQRKGRDRKASGIRHGRGKLTDLDIAHIRASFTAGESQASIASRMRLHPSTVSKIVSNQRRAAS